MRVAIQGTVGSFHDQACRLFFTDNYTIKSCTTFRDVFEAVVDEEVDYGIVAVENSLHGSINSVYRLLSEKKLWVSGEVRLHIEMYLIGDKSYHQSIQNIQKVISQAEAISQCEQWLHDNLTNVVIEESNDTAGSVEYITKHHLQNTAAIAGSNAAHVYNASILAGPINDDPENYTRFFILSKTPMKNPLANRTSIIMTEKKHDSAGNLHDALGVFSNLNINLSKLDSHTLPGKIRRYAFYIDFDENYYSEKGKAAIDSIIKMGWDISILGTYQKYEH